jgi:hypothetical protein
LIKEQAESLSPAKKRGSDIQNSWRKPGIPDRTVEISRIPTMNQPMLDGMFP